jgi:hypothetical protein
MSEQQQKRAPWLDLARRQARSLAKRRALHPRPLDWDALEPAGPRRPRWRAARPALVWSAPLLALLMLGGGTATWAYYVKYVRKARVQRKAESPPPAPTPAPPARTTAPRPKASPRRAHPAVAEQRQAPEARPRPARRKRRAAKARKRADSTSQARRQQPAARPGQQMVIFEVQEIPGGGELIIVTPPPKLEPLWTPEDFRKRGPAGFIE